MNKKCVQCQGVTKFGKRCKNKVSCELGCLKYCWIHSPGYEKQNVKCTLPERRKKRN